MQTCPTCGRRMLMRQGVLLSPMLADIFDLLARHLEGMLPERLCCVLYGEWSRKTRHRLKANVWLLNERLVEVDLKVRAERDGPYRLVAGAEDHRRSAQRFTKARRGA